MSKYEKVNQTGMPVKLEKILVNDEQLIWAGKPKKSAFLINKALEMLPFALIWLLFDAGFIVLAFSTEEAREMLWILIPFFAVHLMPVWIWLSSILTANKKWENMEYAVTNKRIIISSGFIGIDYKSIYYKEIEKVDLKVSAIDKILKVGDIYISAKDSGTAFLDVENAYDIYPKLQEVVLDIQTDIEFPNNLRPKENDGYNTKYTKKI